MFLNIALVIFQIVLALTAGSAVEELVDAADQSISGAAEFLIVIQILFVFIAWYGYFLVQELGPRGATLGKRAVGIRIAARGGGRLTPEAVIARNLLRDIEIFYPLIFIIVTLITSAAGIDGGSMIWAALLWFLVFALFPFFNKDAMRAGDVIAGTWVIDAPHQAGRSAVDARRRCRCHQRHHRGTL